MSQLHDVGLLLLRAQDDLEGVRRELEATGGPGSARVQAALTRAEEALRHKADEVLSRSVAAGPRAVSASSSSASSSSSAAAAAGLGRGGEDHRHGAHLSALPPLDLAAARTSAADAAHAAVAATEGQSARSQAAGATPREGQRTARRCTVAARLRERREAELLMRPDRPGAREAAHRMVGLPPPPPPSSTPRLPRAAGGGRAHLGERRLSGSLGPGAQPLPAACRRDPSVPPPPAMLERLSLCEMLERGLLPKDADCTQALMPALRQRPATFHSHDAPLALGHPIYAPLSVGGSSARGTACGVRYDMADELDRQGARHRVDVQRELLGPSPSPRPSPSPAPAPAVPRSSPPTPSPRAASPAPPAEQARNYDQLLDQYAAHTLLIRRGQSVVDTPEFQSFRRKYAALWGSVAFVLGVLERALAASGVALARVSGPRVVEVAERVEADAAHEPTLREVLRCLDNGGEVAAALRLPGHRYAFAASEDEARALAAAKIQATFRMARARREHRRRLGMEAAAGAIQRAWRAAVRLRDTRAAMAERLGRRIDHWRQHVQAPFVREWRETQRRARVAVHVPSLSLDARQRAELGGGRLQMLQNVALPRLCEARDPLVDVLYVSPFELPRDVERYYARLLEVGGVRRAGAFRLLHPERAADFPPHYSLAEACLLSPRLLRRVREEVRGRPAYLVPGAAVGDEDLRLAVELGLPLLGPEPEPWRAWSSRSGARRVFARAGLPVPPGAHDVYGGDELREQLARLVAENLDVERWIFKLDARGGGGRGLAWLESRQLASWQQLRQERRENPARWREDHTRRLAADRVLIELRAAGALGARARLAAPALYGGRWDAFEAEMARGGGVIEAAPAAEHVVASPSVCLVVEPDGAVRVGATHDQVFGDPAGHRFAGAVHPSAVHHGTLADVASRVGRALHSLGVYGHVGVDLVVYRDAADGGRRRMWPVDLNLGMTQTASTYAMFDFLCGGQLGDDGRYRVRGGAEQRCYAAAPLVRRAHLSALQLGSFFNVCRLRGLSFDLRARTGTAFLLTDSLASGYVGAVCAAPTAAEAAASLRACLAFLESLGGAGAGAGGAADDGSGDDENSHDLRHLLAALDVQLQHGGEGRGEAAPASPR